MYENVNTQVLWDEYGMAAFDLGGSLQPIWNTYYYMKEALKTQKPSVLVLDVFSLTKEEDYSDVARAMKNTFGMKFSGDKIEAITVSYEYEKPLQLMDYILEFPAFHNRYTEISEGDFLGQGKDYNEDGLGIFQCDDWKGFYLNMNIKPLENPTYTEPETGLPLSEKQMLYFRKIIELADDHNIPLLLIASPSVTKEDAPAYYHTVGKIAAEEGIPFVNFNLLYDELNLDFEKDFADVSHLNNYGNEKYSRYLGAYIADHYGVPDRRGDPMYSDYDRMAEWYKNEMKSK